MERIKTILTRTPAALIFLTIGILAADCIMAWFMTPLRFYMDAGYFLYNIVVNNSLFLPHNRFTYIITQSPVLWGRHLLLSLDTLAHIYSVTFPLMHIAAFAFVLWLTEEFWFGAALVLIMLIDTNNFFYMCIGEVQQAAMFAFLVFCLMKGPTSERKFNVVGYCIGIFVFSLAALYIHPLGIALLGFLVLFDLAHRRRISRYQILIAMTAAGSLIINHFFFPDRYGNNKIQSQLIDPMREAMHSSDHPGILHSVFTAIRWNVEMILSQFWAVIAFALIVGLLFRRRRLVLAVVFGVSLLYFIVAALTYQLGLKFHQFYPGTAYYVEDRMRPIYFMFLIPIALYFRDHLPWRGPWHRGHYLGALVIAALVLGHLVGVFNQRPYYAERRDAFLAIARAPDYAAYDKVSIQDANASHLIDLPKGFAGIESLLYTYFDPLTPLKSIYIPDLRGESAYPPQEGMGGAYLALPTGGFHSANSSPTVGELDQFPEDQVALRLTNPRERFRPNARTFCLLGISNESDSRIRSGRDGDVEIIVTFKWYRDGRELDGLSLFTPLLLDVRTEIEQPVWLHTPQGPGIYQIEVALNEHRIKRSSGPEWKKLKVARYRVVVQ